MGRLLPDDAAGSSDGDEQDADQERNNRASLARAAHRGQHLLVRRPAAYPSADTVAAQVRPPSALKRVKARVVMPLAPASGHGGPSAPSAQQGGDRTNSGQSEQQADELRQGEHLFLIGVADASQASLW